MRPPITLTFLLCLPLAVACGSDSDGDGNDDDTPAADAGDVDTADSGGDDTEAALTIETPEISIAAGEEVTYCYYTTLSNDTAVGIKKWESSMTPGSHHMILYFTGEAQKPDGTLDTDACGIGTGDISDTPIWTYAAQDPETEFSMPDGVGMNAKAGQPVVIQMHYLNASDAELEARVTIGAHTFEPGVEYQQAHPYITFNTNIEVAPGEEGSVAGSCAVPAGANFFTMSTHAHHFSTRAQVFDGDSMLVDTDDWEHPAVKDWVDAPHYQFEGNLDYRCEYFNGSEQTVSTGDSAETDEMCMAVGYFFPGTKPIVCLNSFVVPI